MYMSKNDDPKRVESLEKQVKQLENRVLELEMTKHVLAGEVETVKSAYAEIMNSQWWKLTEPGRKLMTKVKVRYGHTVPLRAAKYMMNHGLTATMKKAFAVLTHADVPPVAIPLAESPSQTIYLESVLTQEYCHPSRARVLLVSHEMTLTGAPLVLLYMAEHIKNLGFQPVMIAPKDGPLVKEAIRMEIPVIINNQVLTNESEILSLASTFSMVVANTIVCAPVIHKLVHTDIPVLWWIHEAAVSYTGIGDPAFYPAELTDNIHVYCVCDYARQKMREFCPPYHADILTYYLPDYSQVTSDSQFSLPGHAGKTVFTLIGTMEMRKGQDILAQAIRQLPASIRNKCLFVIVSKEGEPLISEAVHSLCNDFPKSVIHYPLLSRDEITILHQQTDCLLCVSRDDPLPCVITEALSLGKPVICSEFTGYASILREMKSGIVYTKNDPKLLAKSICDFVQKPKLAQEYSSHARETYNRYFSHEVFNKSIRDILCRHLFKLTEEESSAVPEDMDDLYNAIMTLSQPKASVSVVIPAYNGGKELDTLLDLLEKQSGLASLEIIVVDSGSTDDTPENCKRHNVKLIQIPNSEFSHSGARNMGAEAATGDILLFMTQDAKPTSSNWIKNLIAPILHEKVAAVSPKEKCPDGTDWYYQITSMLHIGFLKIEKQDQLNYGMASNDQNQFRAKAALNDVSTAILRKVFFRFRYRLDFAEDLDMGMRLLRSGYSIKLLGTEQVLHGHNRNAGYYLKRGLVDYTVTNRMLNAPATNVSSYSIVSEILDMYSVIQNALYYLDSHPVDSLSAFIETYRKLIYQQDSYTSQSKEAQSIRKELKDPLVESLMEQIKPYGGTVTHASSYFGHSIYFLEQHVSAFIATQGAWKPEMTGLVCECVYKFAVVGISSLLATITQEDPVYEILKPFTQGV